MGHALRKLRGRVTGGLRAGEHAAPPDGPDPDGSDGGPVSDAPPVATPSPNNIPRQWELASIARRRQEAYGRDVKGGT